MDSFFSAIMLALSVFGLCLNLYCSWRIWKTFNLNLALYLILFVNSFLTFLVLSASFGGFLVEMLSYKHDQKLTLCSVIILLPAIAFFTGALSDTLISILRYA